MSIIGTLSPTAFNSFLLKKLTISYEQSATSWATPIPAQFNPEKLSYNRSIDYTEINGVALSPDGYIKIYEFTDISPVTLDIDLFFDTTEEANLLALALEVIPGLPPKPVSVTKYTKMIEKAAKFDKTLHRPPQVRLAWGKGELSATAGAEVDSFSLGAPTFQGVITGYSKTFDLFHADGTPLRASMHVSLKDTAETSRLQSPDVTKVYTVQPYDTLISIATRFYGDPGQWRAIADANNLTNPRTDLTVGVQILIPALA